MRVLVLSRNYPNNVVPRLGLWVQRLVAAQAQRHELTVLAPSVYCPPLPLPEAFAKFRAVVYRRTEGKVEVLHPRFLSGPGYSTYALEAASQYAAVAAPVARMHRARPFDLIHAHFTYPDGVVAALLGRRLGIPSVITEHNFWRPWMDEHRMVRRQVSWAVARASALVAVSRAVRLNMESVLRRAVRAEIVPIGVDGDFFRMKTARAPDGIDRILYVGWLNQVKGVDVLLHAMALVRTGRPGARLSLVGGSVYRDTQVQEQALRRLASDLGLSDVVQFLGSQSPEVVARELREADVVVVPSRRESCGAVLLEALASGTPVVATRSGGPEDIVRAEVGGLVPVADPAALAAAIDSVLLRRTTFDPPTLRQYALERFSWDRLSERYDEIYQAVCARASG
jgi:glycosyltransferase involved in cell wall biosynthesis